MAAVIGDPVAHSRSPAILNAAFAEAGLDWVYVAFRVPAGGGAAAVAAMGALGLGGMSVTMPLKSEVMAALDRLEPDAAALGAVNCVVRDGGELVGHNTDGGGFLDAMADEGVEVPGRRCVVVGAGGAARSVIRALAGAGAAEVVVVNRSPERGRAAAALAEGVGRLAPPADAAAVVATADLLVNATPIGMGGDQGVPVPVESLHPGLFVADLVYHPRRTPLVEAAEAAGAGAADGLGMLVHQAARAFELWTGRDAPLAAMAVAAGGA